MFHLSTKGLVNIIYVPARQFTRAVLNRSVFAGHPKRAVILEYALFNPHEAPLDTSYSSEIA
jgi:hypothetical protein